MGENLPSRHNVSEKLSYKELEKKQETLEQTVEELKNFIEKLMSEKSESGSIVRERYLDDRMDIRPESRIKVISLCPNVLCLTAKQGQRPYTFRKFGEVKRIRYEDLAYIIENHRSFLEDGVFMILDSEVVTMHALDEFYGKILTKENFDTILSENFSDAVKLVENANKRQQRYVAEMIAKKIIEGENISLDFIDKVSRLTGYNIKEIADNSIALKEVYKKKNNEIRL
jgi:hypothetical protein